MALLASHSARLSAGVVRRAVKAGSRQKPADKIGPKSKSTLKSSEDAQLKSVSIFETDEHLQGCAIMRHHMGFDAA